MRKNIKYAFLTIAMIALLAACKKERADMVPAKTIATNIEIGTGNNKQALIGRDFHFNADVTAGNKIKEVMVKIVQKAGEKYHADWKFELAWDEYKGAKNTNVHKHFTIPTTALEGKYDFYFIVNDENGDKMELKADLTITDPANMPVDPKIGRDILSRNGDMIYYMNTYVENKLVFKKGDLMTAHAQVSEIKGDGILYSVLIKRSAKYYPESIDKLDLSKAIVISTLTHQNLGPAAKISTLKQTNGVWGGEEIKIGAVLDGNEPTANPITDAKAWESGDYNWVILYKNTTYNMSAFKSIPITIVY